VAAYVEATNSFDLERSMATFAEDAVVNDHSRDYWNAGHQRVGQARYHWREPDDDATKVINHYGNFIVTANIDGTIISAACLIRWCSPFYFTPQSDIIRRNRFDI
jgi:hypothetical protein